MGLIWLAQLFPEMVGSQRSAGDDVDSAHGERDKATLCGIRKRDELWSKRR